MSAHDFTVASMGHPQHGKSSVLGCLAIALRGQAHLDVLLAAIEKKIRQLDTPELYYSLVFDLPKHDFSLREKELQKDPSKTVSRLPGWLGCRIGDRNAMLVDEPGHTQFLKYIVAPTAGANVCVFVVDALTFIEEYQQTVGQLGEDCFERRVLSRKTQIPLLLKLDREERRSAFAETRRGHRKKRWIPRLCTNLINYAALTEIFKINQVIVAVHQMDKAEFDEGVFENARRQFLRMTKFLIPAERFSFVPTAVLARTRENHNVVDRSTRMGWYHGSTIAELLEGHVRREGVVARTEGPLRLQVERLALASSQLRHAPPARVFGRVDSGSLRVGDTVAFTPAGITARVTHIRLRDEARSYSEEPYRDGVSWEVKQAIAGECVSVVFSGKDFDSALDRTNPRVHWQGQIVSDAKHLPTVSNRMKARLMIVPPWWLEEGLAGFNIIYGYSRNGCKLDSWDPGREQKWWQMMLVDVTLEQPMAIDAFRPGGALGKIVLEREGFIVAGGTVVDVLKTRPH